MALFYDFLICAIMLLSTAHGVVSRLRDVCYHARRSGSGGPGVAGARPARAHEAAGRDACVGHARHLHVDAQDAGGYTTGARCGAADVLQRQHGRGGATASACQLDTSMSKLKTPAAIRPAHAAVQRMCCIGNTAAAAPPPPRASSTPSCQSPRRRRLYDRRTLRCSG